MSANFCPRRFITAWKPTTPMCRSR
nr:TPA_asm: m44.6 sORF 2 [Murid betaherpesvirus 1]DBA07773.1 TPA_asm: m44.6 sORF 2 [Murid betaherpesvirus 1]